MGTNAHMDSTMPWDRTHASDAVLRSMGAIMHTSCNNITNSSQMRLPHHPWPCGVVPHCFGLWQLETTWPFFRPRGPEGLQLGLQCVVFRRARKCRPAFTHVNANTTGSPYVGISRTSECPSILQVAATTMSMRVMSMRRRQWPTPLPNQSQQSTARHRRSASCQA